MKRLVLTLAALSCCSSVRAENLIRWLINQSGNGKDTSKQYEGVTKSQLGNTPFYVYKLKRQNVTQPDDVVSIEHVPMTESEKETARIAIAQQQAEIAAKNHPDNPPIKRVIDKHRESDEAAAGAVSAEKRAVYGANSPLRDDGVIEAWREAEAAQRRLEEHRSYMERVRQARKRVEHAKTVSGDIIQNREGG